MSAQGYTTLRSVGSLTNGIATLCYWGLLALALWAPLPFGSARPWSWGVLTTVVGALVALLAVRDLLALDKGPPPADGIVLPAVLFGLTLLWAILQCLPWLPTSWSPEAWSDSGKLIADQSPRASISVDPAASRAAILHLMTYAGVFWLSFRCCQRSAKAHLFVAGVGAIGTLYAIWGLIVYWTGNHSVLWFPKWAYPYDLTSTFVNRNSYAAYTGLALVALIGLLLEHILQRVDLDQSRRTIARTLIEILTTRAIWFIAGVGITAMALLLSHSRGGATATGAGIVGLFIIASLVPSLRGPWYKWFGVALLVGAVLALWVSGTQTLTRLADTSWDLEGRPEIYRLTLQAISEHPLVGTGLATFKTIFAGYRTEDLKFYIDLAHNDYLENALELGIPAACMMIGAVAFLVVRCLLGAFRRHRDAIIPCIALAATILVGLHSLVDFSMQIPAVAIAYLILLGAGVAQATTTRERRTRAVPDDAI